MCSKLVLLEGLTILFLSAPIDGACRVRRATCTDNLATRANGRRACDGKLIFQDDFTSLEKNRWLNEVRFPAEPEYEFVLYDNGRNNTYVKNGVLFLRPTLLSDKYGEEFLRTGSIKLDEHPQRCTNPPGHHECSRSANNGFRLLPPVISSKIGTFKSFRFRYGVVEIRAKMPAGDWIFSQLELVPYANKYGVAKSGRIVLATTRGNNDLKAPGLSDNRIDFGNRWLEAGVVVHKHEYKPTTTPTILAQLSTQGGWNKDFHIYKFTWEPEKLSFSVDGKDIGPGVVLPPEGTGFLGPDINRMAPFDEDFYISFGVGIGGIQRFPDVVTSNGKPKPWKNLSPKNMMSFWNDKKSWYSTWSGENSALQIDYIKVYAL